VLQDGVPVGLRQTQRVHEVEHLHLQPSDDWVARPDIGEAGSPSGTLPLSFPLPSPKSGRWRKCLKTHFYPSNAQIQSKLPRIGLSNAQKRSQNGP